MSIEKTAGIYVRVSTEEQDTDTQESICREYCKRNEIKVFNVYRDYYSGVKDNRPVFNNLINNARKMMFNMVIVTKLDRMGRSLQHLLNIIDEFRNLKIDFVCVTQNIDTSSSMGKLQFQIMGAFAEFERNLISERTKEALKNKQNVGKRGKDMKKRKARSDRGLKRGGKKKDISYLNEIRNKNDRF